MLHLRISTTTALADAVVTLLEKDSAVSGLAVLRGASIVPQGDVIPADVAREGANQIVDQLNALGVQTEGCVHVEPVQAWLSQRGFDAERRTPGSSADAVVWVDVTQRAYEESELNWTYLSFMSLATLLASIAIVLDSQVLVIGAMVPGPEFVPIAALGLALVRRRRTLFGQALRTLVVGFLVSILLATLRPSGSGDDLRQRVDAELVGAPLLGDARRPPRPARPRDDPGQAVGHLAHSLDQVVSNDG